MASKTIRINHVEAVENYLEEEGLVYIDLERNAEIVIIYKINPVEVNVDDKSNDDDILPFSEGSKKAMKGGIHGR